MTKSVEYIYFYLNASWSPLEQYFSMEKKQYQFYYLIS